MRRIPRLRQSAVFTQCMPAPASASTPAAVTRAAAATSCLGRPRDFSTTPNRTFNPTHAFAGKADSKGPSVENKNKRQVAAKADKHSKPAATAKASRKRDAAIAAAPAKPSTQIQTDLILPITERTIAPRPDELDPESQGYTPVDRADGLEVIGGLKGWFDADKNNWGASQKYVGFAPQLDKGTPPAVLELCAIRAVLEAAAVAALEKPKGKDKATEPRTVLASTWRHGGRDGLNRALQMTWSVTDDGKVQVGEGSVAIAKALLDGPPDKDMVKGEVIPGEEAYEILKNWDQSWKKISLQDVKIKFAVAKRVYQLTGRAIPDFKLLQVENAGQLLSLLVKPPPPRTVYEAVQLHGELAKLPNVQIHPRRVTPVDKARTVGSWKIIEKELEKRGLPVLGHDDVDKYREAEWFRGPRLDKKSQKKRRVH